MNTIQEKLLEICRQYLMDNPDKVAKYLKKKCHKKTDNYGRKCYN